MICPNGHPSSTADYCDTCGAPLVGSQSGGEPPRPAGDPGDRAGPAGSGDSGDGLASTGEMAALDEDSPCPNCSAVNPPRALFCEACGFDYTTGTMPRPAEPAPAPWLTPDAEAPSRPTETADPPQVTPAAPEVVATPGALSPPLQQAWVAEVWIDPDWYGEQQSPHALPSPGVPTVVPLRHTAALIGRRSSSRGIHPDLECGADTGVSRRHAQLTGDGRRWWVEDLGSSNGTYVGDAVGSVPTQPIRPGQKYELDADDRIYLGAWTRIVIRPAAPGEVG